MTLSFGSLFSGIGGIDLGFERAGMTCAWQVEIDDYCNKVLAKHWPDVARYRDVKEVGKHNLPPVDVIAGGFPCQPHSVAGKRRGADDDRNLWPEYLRIITELRPTWVVGENVPGIITTYLDTVLSDLEGAGYEIATFNLPAVAFDAPHRRERIFVVAYSAENGCEWRDTNERGREYNAMGRGEQFSRNGKEELVANAEKQRLAQRGNGPGENTSQNGQTQESRSSGFAGRGNASERSAANYWPAEPRVGRVAHGIPNRVDRLRGLGNAVVPAVAEFIGKQILAANSP